MKAMRREIEGTDVAAAPVVSEGGRSPSTLSTGLPGTPSYAFVGEPQTNGVIERLFRTLKEQIVYGRIFQTVDDVRDAVRAFAARYNAEWLIEKNGHRSPDDARAAWHDQPFRRAA